MSAATIGVTAGIDSALRRAFSEASVRVAPDTRMTDIIAALTALGITATIEDAVLVLRQGETNFNTSLALRNFAKRPEHAKFFVSEGAHPKAWSDKKKIEYLRTHTDAEYRALLQSPVLEAGVKVLDPNMSRKDYEGLTRAERIAFISEFGSDAVGLIFQKAK